MGKYLNFLRESDLFHNLAHTQLEMIESICCEKTFQKGEIIFEENSHDTELYVIISGKVEIFVYRMNDNLENQPREACCQILSIMRRGQSFGEIALVDEGLRSAGVRAAEKNTRLIYIEREKLLQLCNAYVDLGFQVVWNLAVDMAQKIRTSSLNVQRDFMAR